MTKFIFDLDGTLTKQETLPLIAKHFKIEEEIISHTNETIQGNIPFVESFIKRVYILGKLPINEVSDLLKNVPVYPLIEKFVQQNKDECVIVTDYLECWVKNLISNFGCEFHCSDGIIQDNKIKKLTKILHKEDIVDLYKASGERVIFIGDGNNDVEAMRKSDISIASGLTHTPANSVLSCADYLVFSEEALCRQLNQLL